MPIVIQPYREEHEDAVKAFNQRLRAATSDRNLVFYERSSPEWLPPIAGSPLYNQYVVAWEDGAVRGAYALKYERFSLTGYGEYTVACCHHPISEGIVNRSFAAVGSMLLRDAVKREPMLYALGMGGLDRPLAKILEVMGWDLQLVPFYFRVVHPGRFLRQMNALRQSRWRRWLMDLGAFSGTGWLAVTAAQNARRLLGRVAPFEMTEVDEFPKWTDTLWLETKDNYALTSVRDLKTISRLYPPGDQHLTKLCLSQQGKPVGWAVVGERRKDPKFGSLRVGSIVDCWAHPENAAQVMLAATQTLERKGLDLIVSNQSHKQWCRALETSGFLQADSNFVFATSKKHSALLHGELSEFHLNRANGDGLPRNF
jgi:hypothetical protein